MDVLRLGAGDLLQTHALISFKGDQKTPLCYNTPSYIVLKIQIHYLYILTEKLISFCCLAFREQ